MGGMGKYCPKCGADLSENEFPWDDVTICTVCGAKIKTNFEVVVHPDWDESLVWWVVE